MKFSARALAISLAVILLLASLTACRNRDFHPATPPPAENNSGERGDDLPADFQCWVKWLDGNEYALSREDAVKTFDTVKKIYGQSDTIHRFPDKEGGVMIIFCTGGTAPETTIPAYQLPNATLYGVYTLFPDDTGRYGDNLITASVHAFKLKKGSYDKVTALIQEKSLA